MPLSMRGHPADHVGNQLPTLRENAAEPVGKNIEHKQQALEQAISWVANHGGTEGLVHHSDHGIQYIGLVYTTRVREFGMLPSTGTVGDPYDNAMAESVNGAYKAELVWRRKPFADLKDLELATFRWVSWRGLEATAPVPGLQDTGSGGNRVLCEPSGTSRLTVRAEQRSGHFRVRCRGVVAAR